MKYHIVSTSKSGHGAIFTSQKEANDYMKKRPISTYTWMTDLPSRIPPMTPEEPTKTKSINDSSDITIYTDGSALGNPGPGGYGVVMIADSEITELSEGYLHTTNNRMEMMAVIAALEAQEDTERSIKVFSDSKYVLDSLTKGWAKSWQKKGWKKGDGKPAKNPDLWERMLNVVERFPKLSFLWVKGHAGDQYNEIADELANSAAQESCGQLEDVGYNG